MESLALNASVVVPVAAAAAAAAVVVFMARAGMGGGVAVVDSGNNAWGVSVVDSSMGVCDV